MIAIVLCASWIGARMIDYFETSVVAIAQAGS
jgi:hypothetical protein